MIKFHFIQYKNFLGTGELPTRIQLDSNRTTLVTGANGSGKSTILDALCFALYGKAYRNINKPQLVNSVNTKRCEVVVEFTKGDSLYTVTRGIGPNKFEILINGQPATLVADARQEQAQFEKNVLGMDYTAFTQIVILGSARYQSFMDLDAGKRKEVVEKLLDIDIFSRMNEVLSERVKSLKISADALANEKMLKESSIRAVQRLMDAETAKDNAYQVDNAAEMEKQLQLVDECDNKIKATTAAIDALVAPDVDTEAISNNVSKARLVASRVHDLITKAEQTISFYTDHDHCEVCGQSIDADFANKLVGEAEASKAQNDSRLKTVNDQLATLRADMAAANEAVDAHGRELARLMRERDHHTAQRDAAKTYYKSLKDKAAAPIVESKLPGYRQEMEALEADLGAMEADLDAFAKRGHHMAIAKALLKDTGIKAKIVAQYLPVMNQLINDYLDRMGADYSFTLDASFTEVIKSRYRDKFSYNSFSEGQKMRIDLALMFTWREVARLKNSVNTNLLILDEIGDSSLDGNGASILWDVLNGMEGSNVFVISHRANNAEMFDNQLVFKQVGNFSKLAD